MADFEDSEEESADESPLLQKKNVDLTKQVGTYPVADWLSNMFSDKARDSNSPDLAGYGPSDAGATTPSPVSARPELMSTVSNTDPVTDLVGLLALNKQKSAEAPTETPEGPMSRLPASVDKSDDDSAAPTKSAVRMPAGSKNGALPSEIDVGESRYGQKGLLAAQRAQAGAELTAGLGKAFNTIGAGITRTQVDPNQQKAFDVLGKDAGAITQNYLEQQANEKNDANSPQSKAFRQYAKSLGVEIKGDFSAADGEKILPMIFKGYEAKEAQQARTEDLKYKLQMHSDDMKQRDKDRAALMQQLQILKGQGKTSGDQDKFFSKTNQQITNLSKGRGAIGNAYEAERLTNNADLLLQKYAGHYDQMPQKDVNLFISELGKIAKGGVAGHSEFKEFVPRTLGSRLSEGWSNLSGNPTGAGVGKFIADYGQYLHELRNTSQGYIGNTINDIVRSNEPIIGDAHAATLRQVHKRYLDRATNNDNPIAANTMPGAVGGAPVGGTQAKTVTIRRKSDGLSKQVSADKAQAYLQSPDFEQVM